MIYSSALVLLAVVFRPSAACTPCLAGLISKLPLNNKNCNADTLHAFLTAQFNQRTPALRQNRGCPWAFSYELELLTNTTNADAARNVLGKMCNVDPPEIPTTEWTDIDMRLTPDFMDNYTDGFTPLNDRIGNFKNPNKATDPRKNTKYPTDEFSYTMGMSIDKYYDTGSRTSALQPVPHLENCEHQTIMCCFGSDRQHDDNNGDCAATHCDNGKPADNTNVCYHKGKRYRGDETAHCHGFAWSNDPKSPTYLMRFNNLFYVNMYDHMYTRGYVKSVYPGAMKMCSCIERMPVVSRADCTEITTTADYTVSVDVDGQIEIVIKQMSYDYQACQGYNPTVDANQAQNNELLAYVERLYREDQMDGATRHAVGVHLVQNCQNAGFGSRQL